MNRTHRHIPVCPPQQIGEKQFRLFPILFKGEPHTAFVYRFNGEIRSYINQCVHMPRPLNCQSPTIFDKDREHLRCSMHGIVYDAETAQSVSTLCNGEGLQPLRFRIIDDCIVIDDKKVMPLSDQSIT